MMSVLNLNIIAYDRLSAGAWLMCGASLRQDVTGTSLCP